MPPVHPAGWYPDPGLGDGLRYWDGWRWTTHVAFRRPPPPPPHPRLPLAMACGALAVIFASLVASRFVLQALADFEWPIPVYVVIAGLAGYGPVLVFCWWASRTMGSGSLRADAGLYARRGDWGWGPLTWLCCLAAQIVLGIVVVTTGIPFTSNTEAVDGPGATRGYVIALLVLAVVAAPVVEEIVFRGVVLRGLLERMGALPAVALQAVVFGAAHYDPARGAGNIGLLIILSGVGFVLGGASYRFRRITPTIAAHAIINALAMALALSGVADRV